MEILKSCQRKKYCDSVHVKSMKIVRKVLIGSRRSMDFKFARKYSGDG